MPENRTTWQRLHDAIEATGLAGTDATADTWTRMLFPHVVNERQDARGEQGSIIRYPRDGESTSRACAVCGRGYPHAHLSTDSQCADCRDDAHGTPTRCVLRTGHEGSHAWQRVSGPSDPVSGFRQIGSEPAVSEEDNG